MGRYSDELINKYIMGYEIDNIDELENNKSFMMQVIDKSNDYRLYNLCSDKLKKNYSFVKYLVLKFKDNVDFISKVADYYLNNTKDEFSRVELVAIMISLTKQNKEKYMQYRMFGHSLYYFKRVQIESIKKNLDDEDLLNEIGMGFLLIFEEYNHSKIVLDFYAKRFIDGIFDEYNIDIEYMLHEQFDSFDKICEIGINNYMINFISYYDSMLANYVSVNINLLNDFKKRIMATKDNWERFENKCEYAKYNLLFEKVHEYIRENDSLIDETTYLYYIGNKLGVADKILFYDSLYVGSLEEVLDEIDEEYIKDAIEFSFEERRHLNNIKKIMIDILFSKKNKDEIINSKVLKIDFKNRKK